MTKNMGTLDKTVRIIVAVGLIVLALALKIVVALKVIFLLIAAVFVLTSLISYCPLYTPLKIKTRKQD
jgi:hypothetical protein